MYEFKMDLFDNGDPEEFIFVINVKMMIEAPGMFISNKNIQYLCTILRGEALRKFDTLCLQIISTTVTHLNQVILALGM